MYSLIVRRVASDLADFLHGNDIEHYGQEMAVFWGIVKVSEK